MFFPYKLLSSSFPPPPASLSHTHTHTHTQLQKYSTLPSPRSMPRSRTPDSPLPPIPMDKMTSHQTPSLEFSFLSTTPTASPCSSPLTISRASSNPNSRPSSASKGEPLNNYYHSPNLGPRITVSSRPPAPLPHKVNRSTSNGKRSSSDEEDEVDEYV